MSNPPLPQVKSLRLLAIYKNSLFIEFNDQHGGLWKLSDTEDPDWFYNSIDIVPANSKESKEYAEQWKNEIKANSKYWDEAYPVINWRVKNSVATFAYIWRKKITDGIKSGTMVPDLRFLGAINTFPQVGDLVLDNGSNSPQQIFLADIRNGKPNDGLIESIRVFNRVQGPPFFMVSGPYPPWLEPFFIIPEITKIPSMQTFPECREFAPPKHTVQSKLTLNTKEPLEIVKIDRSAGEKALRSFSINSKLEQMWLYIVPKEGAGYWKKVGLVATLDRVTGYELYCDIPLDAVHVSVYHHHCVKSSTARFTPSPGDYDNIITNLAISLAFLGYKGKLDSRVVNPVGVFTITPNLDLLRKDPIKFRDAVEAKDARLARRIGMEHYKRLTPKSPMLINYLKEVNSKAVKVTYQPF